MPSSFKICKWNIAIGHSFPVSLYLYLWFEQSSDQPGETSRQAGGGGEDNDDEEEEEIDDVEDEEGGDSGDEEEEEVT